MEHKQVFVLWLITLGGCNALVKHPMHAVSQSSTTSTHTAHHGACCMRHVSSGFISGSSSNASSLCFSFSACASPDSTVSSSSALSPSLSLPEVFGRACLNACDWYVSSCATVLMRCAITAEPVAYATDDALRAAAARSAAKAAADVRYYAAAAWAIADHVIAARHAAMARAHYIALVKVLFGKMTVVVRAAVASADAAADDAKTVADIAASAFAAAAADVVRDFATAAECSAAVAQRYAARAVAAARFVAAVA